MQFYYHLRDWLAAWRRATTSDPLERYLAQSSDLYDLEFRFQQVAHGCAPFQRHALPFAAKRCCGRL